MTSTPTAQQIPGYTYGTSEAAHSTSGLDDLDKLKAAVGLTEEDQRYLRMAAADVLADQADDMVTAWRAQLGEHQHLATYSTPRTQTGPPTPTTRQRPKAFRVKASPFACVVKPGSSPVLYQFIQKSVRPPEVEPLPFVTALDREHDFHSRRYQLVVRRCEIANTKAGHGLREVLVVGRVWSENFDCRTVRDAEHCEARFSCEDAQTENVGEERDGCVVSFGARSHPDQAHDLHR